MTSVARNLKRPLVTTRPKNGDKNPDHVCEGEDRGENADDKFNDFHIEMS